MPSYIKFFRHLFESEWTDFFEDWLSIIRCGEIARIRPIVQIYIEIQWNRRFLPNVIASRLRFQCHLLEYTHIKLIYKLVCDNEKFLNRNEFYLDKDNIECH